MAFLWLVIEEHDWEDEVVGAYYDEAEANKHVDTDPKVLHKSIVNVHEKFEVNA